MSTAIQWTDETWNPVTGCTKVSPGCKNCYAETIAERFWGTRKFTDVRCHEDRLSIPLKWKQQKMIFVNSMSDLFHDDVPDEYIHKVFDVIGKCPHHVFQILTKRHQRLRHWNFLEYPNAWIGVSCETQNMLNERIDSLLATPAVVRWVSLEPLLEHVTFRWASWEPLKRDAPTNELDGLRRLNWIVIGGESGLLKDVRPFNIDWASEIIRQCKEAGVPVFMKQIGSHAVKTDIKTRYKTRHKKGGEMAEWPRDLWVREYPVK